MANIQFTEGHAKDSKNECKYWSGNRRRDEGREKAGKLMKDWGITKGGSTDEPPYAHVRDPESYGYLSCEVVENIFNQSSLQYDDAYDRHESAGGLAWTDKCRADIDMAKWAKIRDWADGARMAQSDTFNSCDEEEWTAAGDAVTDLQLELLSDKQDTGMSNTTKLALIGTGVLLVITILLSIKKK
jgi:LPXTG-motif cell wall-anchored protein